MRRESNTSEKLLNKYTKIFTPSLHSIKAGALPCLDGLPWVICVKGFCFFSCLPTLLGDWAAQQAGYIQHKSHSAAICSHDLCIPRGDSIGSKAFLFTLTTTMALVWPNHDEFTTTLIGNADELYKHKLTVLRGKSMTCCSAQIKVIEIPPSSFPNCPDTHMTPQKSSLMFKAS